VVLGLSCIRGCEKGRQGIGMNGREKVHRFHIEMPESALRELDEFKELGAAATRKEVLNTALEALRWMVREKLEGATIVSFNEETKNERELVLPLLERMVRRPRAAALGRERTAVRTSKTALATG
jgi:hypothetical protein